MIITPSLKRTKRLAIQGKVPDGAGAVPIVSVSSHTMRPRLRGTRSLSGMWGRYELVRTPHLLFAFSSMIYIVKQSNSGTSGFNRTEIMTEIQKTATLILYI